MDEFLYHPARLQKVAGAIRAIFASGELTLEDSYVAVGDDFQEAVEGRVLTAVHRKRERNRKLIQRAKEKRLGSTGALACDACGFDFLDSYGERGRGFIEVHHTKPVSELRPGETTRLADLALLRANCHRIIHLARPWLSIVELSQLLALQREGR
ncbi:HNH endonuclease [Maricaulis sp. CAU 1757]